MTKVTLEYHLLRALQDQDAEAVANAQSVYGIERVRLAPALDHITVDYDASRLTAKDVEALLIRLGVPLKRT